MDLDLKLASKEINEMLWRDHKTLSTAESCTAGRIASVITAVPGSSNYFKGGLICYADEVKEQLLDVDADIIEEKPASVKWHTAAETRALLSMMSEVNLAKVRTAQPFSSVTARIFRGAAAWGVVFLAPSGAQ